MLTASIQCLTNIVDVNMTDVYDVKTYATHQVLARDEASALQRLGDTPCRLIRFLPPRLSCKCTRSRQWPRSCSASFNSRARRARLVISKYRTRRTADDWEACCDHRSIACSRKCCPSHG